MSLTKQQLIAVLYESFDFDGLGVKPAAVGAAASRLLQRLTAERLTRQQLSERAQQVAASFGVPGSFVACEDDLVALARAWGVEVDERLPRLAMTSKSLNNRIFDADTNRTLARVEPCCEAVMEAAVRAYNLEQENNELCPSSGVLCLYGNNYHCSCGMRGQQTVDRRIPDHRPMNRTIG